MTRPGITGRIPLEEACVPRMQLARQTVQPLGLVDVRKIVEI
jgi:hypothetical protein